jgi:predicted DCC family thiol-disulfide oxidoreductase YuxK
VLYDPRCKLCAFVADWLARQRQLVPIDLVPAGSGEALRRFPELDHAATVREITAVGDQGQVYRGDNAFVVCLWALAGHREFSHTLTRPAGRRLARAAVLSAAKYRGTTSHGVPVRPAAGPPREATYGLAPGWAYDRATGWTQVPVPSPGPAPRPGTGTGTGEPRDTCTDGCGPDPG